MSFAQDLKVNPADPLAVINTILISAMEAPNRQALEFIITNDTRKVIAYDRAILCHIHNKKISLISISGQSTVHSLTEFYKKLTDLVNCLEDPGSSHLLSADKFTKNKDIWAEYQRQHSSEILWQPIYSQGELTLGLWIEKWNVQPGEKPLESTLGLLSQYLLPGYGAAWNRFSHKLKVQAKTSQKISIFFPVALAVVGLLYFIHLPLRIVAPCEVEPKDPTIITAPLQGVIEKVAVSPGQQVDKGTVLVKYDDRLFAQELKVALNEYAISEAALNRALSLGVNDPNSLSEVAVLQLKMQKQKIDVQLAKDNYEKINIKSPTKGSVIIDDVDQWAGKPVQIGEKIMTVADLSKSKVKIWIPENDNIQVNANISIEVILNVDPARSHKAKIDYVGNEVVISDQQIPSFVAEANWENPETEVKPGLKGTAVIYGEKVSLFYYLIRKPWMIVRKITGF